MTLLDDLLTALVLIIVFYILFFLGKWINDLLHKEYNLTYELVERDNPALCLAMAGYYLGLVLAIGGTVVGPSGGLINDILDLVIYGILSIILLNLSWYMCDKLILYQFKISDELIRDQNPGTGAVSFGVSVASGLVIFGSVAGEGGSIWSAAAFWLVGQLMLICAAWVYKWMVPFDLHAEIEKDNIAAGVSFGGALIAVGIVVGLSAKINFYSWTEDLPRFVVIALISLVLLPGVRFLTDKVLLPTVKLTDEIAMQEVPNVGAAYIEALSYIGGAFVVYWCV